MLSWVIARKVVDFSEHDQGSITGSRREREKRSKKISKKILIITKTTNKSMDAGKNNKNLPNHVKLAENYVLSVGNLSFSHSHANWPKKVQKDDLVHNAFFPKKSADGKGLNCLYTARIIPFFLLRVKLNFKTCVNLGIYFLFYRKTKIIYTRLISPHSCLDQWHLWNGPPKPRPCFFFACAHWSGNITTGEIYTIFP